MALIGSQSAAGRSNLSGKAYVVFPQSYIPSYKRETIEPSMGCGTALACASSSYVFCMGMKNHRGAYVPAVTVCQNLWILDSPETFG